MDTATPLPPIITTSTPRLPFRTRSAGRLERLAEIGRHGQHVGRDADHVEALLRILSRLLPARAVDADLLALRVRRVLDPVNGGDELGIHGGFEDRMADVVAEIEGAYQETIDAGEGGDVTDGFLHVEPVRTLDPTQPVSR